MTECDIFVVVGTAFSTRPVLHTVM